LSNRLDRNTSSSWDTMGIVHREMMDMTAGGVSGRASKVATLPSRRGGRGLR